MESIEQLIDNAAKELENTTGSSDMVGNRPHFPMCIFMNGQRPAGCVQGNLQTNWSAYGRRL